MLFKNKKVIITGHTGFKGSWLSLWLSKLGANVIGISDNIPSNPSNFEALSLSSEIEDYRFDLINSDKINELMIKTKPDFVFHLAAQPIVKKAYENPLQTYNTNIIGTLNVLEALRLLENNCIAVLITSDKCYENVEWLWGYKETDQLGGKDPYSASKAAAEIAISSYSRSFFSSNT